MKKTLYIWFPSCVVNLLPASCCYSWFCGVGGDSGGGSIGGTWGTSISWGTGGTTWTWGTTGGSLICGTTASPAISSALIMSSKLRQFSISFCSHTNIGIQKPCNRTETIYIKLLSADTCLSAGKNLMTWETCNLFKIFLTRTTNSEPRTGSQKSASLSSSLSAIIPTIAIIDGLNCVNLISGISSKHAY